MPFSIEEEQKPLEGGEYRATARLGLTADGEVVDAYDLRSVTLLCTPGDVIPGKRARELGLVIDGDAVEAATGALGEESSAIDDESAGSTQDDTIVAEDADEESEEDESEDDEEDDEEGESESEEEDEAEPEEKASSEPVQDKQQRAPANKQRRRRR